MPFWNSPGQKNQYYTFTKLLGLQDQGYNMPLAEELRYNRIQSVQKMLNLIELAMQTRPNLPLLVKQLDPFDPQWEDRTQFPIINHSFFAWRFCVIGLATFFYSYNYTYISMNYNRKFLRWFLPLGIFLGTMNTYVQYRKQVLKVNLFDEYCWLRSQELVKQNSYLLNHQDFKKYVYWIADFTETMHKIHRQKNTNTEADFSDSELILQNFLNRYVDPNAKSPMENHTQLFIWNP